MNPDGKITIGQLMGAIENAKKEAILRSIEADRSQLSREAMLKVESRCDEAKDALSAACAVDANFASFEVLANPLKE